MGKTIIVSNRLPVRIENFEGKIQYKLSEGGLATGLGFIMEQEDSIWIGWPGQEIEESQEKPIRTTLAKSKLVPVFLSEDEIEKYYEGFSNETLWPAFHYFIQYIIFSESNWESYVEVNRKFCEEIKKVLEPGDTVWIHDYQLLLVPAMLREFQSNCSIGFFQHIPFPSYEVFRTIPWRKELLKGILGADLIGFHTYDDVRHFLSSVNRLVGISNEHGELKYGQRIIQADAFPLGIHYDKYNESASHPKTLSKEVRYRTSIGQQRIILSIDRLDYSKGIPHRLRVFDRFLEENPDFKEQVSLILIVVPSRDSVGKYKELKDEIDLLVGSINSKYGRMSWSPIHYFYRSYPLEALSAFYRMADVMLVTPMRDGMNLVCKEYVASKLDQTGVLILSEMAGASKELSEAILINPNNQQQFVSALHQALIMPIEEQKERMEVMQESLKRYNVFHWVELFMNRLEHIKLKQDDYLTKKLTVESNEIIKEAFKSSNSALLLLDYDGTLMPFHKDPTQVQPDSSLIKVLSTLCERKNTEVVIISGRDADTLEKWLGEIPVHFIAEHGLKIKNYGDKNWTKEFVSSKEWKNEVRELLELYVSRTPGSFIEEKEFALVWHFRKVETGLGEMRSRELTSHVKYLTNNSDLQVLEGDMVLEVKPITFNKGKSALKWIGQDKYDFIMAIGDDLTDEDTFVSLPKSAYTIKVGDNFSSAKFAVDNYQSVRQILNSLV